jgi:xylulokinase
MGAGIYADHNEAFSTLEKIDTIVPSDTDKYEEAYAKWKAELEGAIKDLQ